MRFQPLVCLALAWWFDVPMLALCGCSGQTPSAPPAALDFIPPPSDAGRVSKPDASAVACGASTVEGCPCVSEGEMVDCGRVYQRSGTYLTCSEGFQTCVDGSWGACVGDRIVTPP